MKMQAVWIECDICEESQVPLDLSCSNTLAARNLAKRDGWKRMGNKDICEECYELRELAMDSVTT